MSSLRNISGFLPPYSSVALRAISASGLSSDKDDDLLPAVSTIPTSWYEKQRLKMKIRYARHRDKKKRLYWLI